MSWDEALALPSEEAVKLALRTQQIVAYESGVTRTADPLGGSYYVESLTDELERRIRELIDAIERDGGVVEGIEDGRLEAAIAEAAYRQERQIESGERVVVGVNRFRDEEAEEQAVELLTVPEDVRARQLEQLARVRGARDASAVVEQRSNAFGPPPRRARTRCRRSSAPSRAYATLGEISAALGDVFGYHRASTSI